MRDAELIKRAREMRKEMTEPETRLWLQLRAKRFAEVKFRRQKVIQDEQHRYIVDFAANDPKLVIELDGESHAASEGYDAARTRFLKGKGYRVVRYTNLEVMQNLDGVLQHLASVIADTQPPLPTLSPEGERAFVSLSPSGERVGERGTP
ncbi:MAG: endonuclease domain-containing protein [Tsuneonella sp.]